MNNRVDLLTELIYTDQEKAEEAFDVLVPTYYSELYVLYDILSKAELIGQCEVTLPNISQNTLSIEISLDKNGKKAVNDIIKDSNGTFTPFKNSKSIQIETKSVKNGIILLFEE